MRLALGQINTTVGDVAGNAELIRDGIQSARRHGADLVMFPELALTGYPPEDLLLKEHFLADAADALRELATETTGIVALVGFPERADDVYNALAVLTTAPSTPSTARCTSPTTACSTSSATSRPGPPGSVLDLGTDRVGLTICEDIWEPGPPASDEALAGATLIVNISASPYHAGKGMERERMFAQRARDNVSYVAFCGLVGGQDELVFDGDSCVLDHTGTTIARAPQFREQLLLCDVDLEAAAAARLRDPSHRPAARRSRDEVIRVPPCRPPRRAGQAAIGADLTEPLAPKRPRCTTRWCWGSATTSPRTASSTSSSGSPGASTPRWWRAWPPTRSGPSAVSAAVMPSRYSSPETQRDAHALAEALGIAAVELPIEPMVDAYDEVMRSQLADAEHQPHPGEPPGPDPRQHADGALERVRLAGADDRQQVGDVGRLHHPLRRPRGRLRRHQGRPQDARLPALPVAQLARLLPRRGLPQSGRPGRRRRSRRASSSGHPRPSCGPTSVTMTPCPPTRCSTGSSRATSSSTRAASS